MKDFDDRFGDILQKYLNRTNKEFIYNYDNLLPLTDDFIANIENGINIDKFYKETNITKEEFYPYAEKVKMFYLYNISCDPTTCVMAAKPFMEDIINYMDSKIKSEVIISDNQPKMVIHGGHDTTVKTIQYFMYEAFNIPIRYVKFGSYIYFELYKEDVEGKYTVKFILDGEELLNKDYKIFKKNVLKHIWSDDQVEKFCYRAKKEDNFKTKVNNTVVILIITNIIFALTSAIFIFLYCKNKGQTDSIKSDTLLPSD